MNGRKIKSISSVEVGELDPIVCEEKLKGKIVDGKCVVALAEFDDGSKEFIDYSLLKKKGD